MSEKTPKPSHSSNRPRYLYLDKFERRVIKVDAALGYLEQDLSNAVTENKVLRRKIYQNRRIILVLIISSVISLTLSIFTLLM